MSPCADELKLVALDRDDIEVMSAHVQDAMVRVSDVLWLPRQHRFVMALNRFDWMSAIEAMPRKIMPHETMPYEAIPQAKADYRRCRTALRFDRVSACKCRNLDQSDKDVRLNLLAVEFTESDPPAGIVTLTFSGGGAIRLEVECLEAELADLGEVSATVLCPNHFAAGSTAV